MWLRKIASVTYTGDYCMTVSAIPARPVAKRPTIAYPYHAPEQYAICWSATSAAWVNAFTRTEWVGERNIRLRHR